MANLSLAGVELFEKPESTVRKFFRQCFRDESYAAIFCLCATAFVYWLLASVLGVDVENTNSIWITVGLVLAGPVLEKGGFFKAYLWAARDQCIGEREVTRLKRFLLGFRYLVQRRFWKYFVQELREQHFLRVLRADILYHDSFYALFMFLLNLIVQPQEFTESFYFIPHDLLVSGAFGAISFGLALVMAVNCEVRYVEWDFRRFLRKLEAKKGKLEYYGELRYLVEGRKEVFASFLPKMRERMGVGADVHRSHKDWVVEGTCLKRFNEWRGFMQLRESPEGIKLHVVYYRTRMVPPSKDTVISVFYVEKIKVAIPVAEASEAAIRACLGKLAKKVLTDEVIIKSVFSYERTYASQPDTISFALDQINEVPGNGEQHALVEVKLWPKARHFAGEAHIRVMSRPWKVLETTQPRALTPEMLAELKDF